MKEDQAIAEIREVRRQISEECDHDPRRLITYYKELQLRHKERLLRPTILTTNAEPTDLRNSS
jgi:hypothetical protein